MPDLTQSSFTAGEVDPALWGRKDQGIYSSGLRRAVNMVVHEGGGIYNREGFRFVGRIKDEEVGARLLHFRFTSGDEYIIEAGVQYFRFWRDNAAVLAGNPFNIEGVTKGADTVVTLEAGHGLTEADDLETQFYIQDCVGIPEINERMFSIKAISTNDVTLGDPSYPTVAVDSSEWTGAWTSGGTMDRPYELTFDAPKAHITADKIQASTQLTADDRNVGPPYSEDDLPFLDYQQTGDIVTIVHPAHPIYELKRFGHTSWRMEIKSFPDTTHTSTDDMGQAVMTTVNSGDFFGNDLTNVMNYLYNRDGEPGTDNSSEQTGEYPSIIGFFQQRRVLSGRGATPDTVFYSAIGDYDDFVANPNVTADSAFRATLATPTLSSIVAAVSLREDIIFLTDDSVWGVRSAGPGFTAANLFQAPQSRIPADPVRPVNFDDDVLFVRKGGRSLISVRFDNNSGRYTPIDLSLSARQIFSCGGTRAGLIQTFFDRLRRVVVPNGEGQLAHLSVNLAYNLTAWTRWVTEGEFEASGVTLGDESYYTVIRRTVGGRTRRFIEVNHPHRRDRQLEDQFFVDSGLTYAGDGAEGAHTFSYAPLDADPNELCPEDITIFFATTALDQGGDGDDGGDVEDTRSLRTRFLESDSLFKLDFVSEDGRFGLAGTQLQHYNTYVALGLPTLTAATGKQGTSGIRRFLNNFHSYIVAFSEEAATAAMADATNGAIARRDLEALATNLNRGARPIGFTEDTINAADNAGNFVLAEYTNDAGAGGPVAVFRMVNPPGGDTPEEYLVTIGYAVYTDT